MQNVDQPADVRGNCLFVTVINETLPLATDWHQDVILEAQTFVSINGTIHRVFHFSDAQKKIYQKVGTKKAEENQKKSF